jgi:threonine dehydratase
MTVRDEAPGMASVREAARRIAPFVHRTPVATCAGIDRITGAHLFFKCENLQKVGAFKARGATNAVLSLADDDARHGVTTHSSGNHAAALARAAGLRGVPAYIVMPRTAPRVKQAAVAGYGAEITFCDPTLEARETTLKVVQEHTRAAFVHPYNDPAIIAGQGTAALELLEEVNDLEIVMAPVGGGGLMSGTAIATSGTEPSIEILGAEPAGADDARRSLESGVLQPSVDPQTIADGLLTSLGSLTFAIISRHVAAILTASEPAIVRAMRMFWERTKLLIEPSAAVPLAAILEHPDRFRGRRVGIILSGGNVDLDRLPWRGSD